MHSLLLTRRTLLRAGVAGAAACVAACAVPSLGTAPPRLRRIGEATLAHRLKFQDTVVGGLSALDHDPARGSWVALSDDRSELGPARFYTLSIGIGPDALAVQLRGVHLLRQADGSTYPARHQGGDVPDPEGMRLLPSGNLLWSSEGDIARGLSPALREIQADGSHVRDFALPPMLRARPAADKSGPRNNLALEGLALTPDGRGAWAAMENALQQDGPIPTAEAPGGPCRITLFDVAGGTPLRQLAYVPDAIPARAIPPGAFADNGVSEILMADADRMLVLERAFMMGRGFSLRLYQVDVREGSDTLAVPQLAPGNHRPAPKTLLADFAQLGLARLDNLEGMCWGPPGAGGARTLVFVSDDNFNPLQVTQFVACEFLE
ncbi:esterase-like activity of phytase family protein [Ramlibacter sp.]|uniref:esterase-like activity of phytase family protein n=1 Tax=Ramlibacter sp. TaxID=1917967 RepID=UPI0017D22CE8|nr:esterase-like activity of phytase family protein [Ramlibacter sp.]MBA2675105.1 esterase-like activity of phytase family protein [Ramlibacter sp.]